MVVYAVYVPAFPPCLQHAVPSGSGYSALVDDFAVRRARFVERLSESQVQEIVATRVIESRARFKWWFWSTVGIYALLVILALSAALAVPTIVSKEPTTVQPSPTQLQQAPTVDPSESATDSAACHPRGKTTPLTTLHSIWQRFATFLLRGISKVRRRSGPGCEAMGAIPARCRPSPVFAGVISSAPAGAVAAVRNHDMHDWLVA